jgi:hypothetical protein
LLLSIKIKALRDLLSPVTLKRPVTLFDAVATKDIVSVYRGKLSFDVSRFFGGLEEVSIFECTATKYKFYFLSEVTEMVKFMRVYKK